MNPRSPSIPLLIALAFTSVMALAYDASGSAQMPATPPTESPLATPVPDASTDDAAAEIALRHVAAKEALAVQELQVVGQEQLTFYQLGRIYTLVTLLHDRPEQTRQFSVLVDPATGEVEEDVDGVYAAEADAHRARYGKLHPELHGLVQTASKGALLPIAVFIRCMVEDEVYHQADPLRA